jgi:type IV pilus assembly protein PilM
MNFSILKKKLWLDFLKSRNRSVAGVDIGSSSIKIVQLRKQKERAILETYGELAMAPYRKGPIGQAVHLDDKTIIQAIKDISKEAGITAKRIVVSIPLRRSFVTTIELPKMSDKDLEKAMPFEARKHIPVSLSEVILNWQIIPRYEFSSQEEGNLKKTTANILLVAVYKDIIDKFRSIISGAGLNFSAFEIEIFSAARAVLRREVYPVLLIDFGASTTKMTIVEQGIVRFAYSLDRGSQDLTLALARSLSIDFPRAESLKREIGLSNKPEHKELASVLESIVSYIFSDAHHMILEYKKRYNRSVEKTIISGGGALLPGIVDFAVNKFGMQTEMAVPFSKTQYPSFLEPVLSKTGSSFSNAIGLALREL